MVSIGACHEYQDPGNTWASHPEAIVHPVEDSLLSYSAASSVMSVSSDDPPDPAAAELLAALSDFDGGTVFGQFDGAADSVMGDLVDAVILSDGDIAVLDKNYGAVRLFTPELQPQVVLGGFGEGPGELQEPVAIFENPRGWISVVDAGGVRIERFESSHAQGRVKRTPLPVFHPLGGCAIKQKVFLAGVDVTFDYEARTANLDSSEAIHEIDPEGILTNSFSIPYAGMGDYMVSSTYSPAHLECEEIQGEEWIWAAFLALGEVHAMDGSGNLRWITRLSDFKYPNQIQTPEAFGMDPSQTDLVELIVNVSSLADSLLAVQVSSTQRVFRAQRETSYRTYLLRKETGEFVGAFSGSHQILGSGSEGAVLYRADPHPQISLVGLGG
jgi:hypothetical protein